MPVKKTPVNLDDKYAARIEENRSKRKISSITMFGRDWQVTDGQSVVQVMDVVTDETGQSFIELCLAMIVEEEREDFHAQLKQPGVDAEMLLEILDDLMVVASGGRPTGSSAASSTTSRTTKRAGQSKANSSGRASASRN